MRGQINYLQVKTSKPKKSYGFIRGIDGKMYWFSLNMAKGVSVGDIVEFEGAEDEKGYYATQIQTSICENVH